MYVTIKSVDDLIGFFFSFLYRLPYDDIFGGVSAMTVDQFRQVNGFSNKFWGWGGEDDDISNRLRQKKLYISLLGKRTETNINLKGLL